MLNGDNIKEIHQTGLIAMLNYVPVSSSNSFEERTQFNLSNAWFASYYLLFSHRPLKFKFSKCNLKNIEQSKDQATK